MKLSRGPLTGVQTGTRLTDTVLRVPLLSIHHSTQTPPNKGLSRTLSPAQATNLLTGKHPTLPPALSTNTPVLLWTRSPIWP